MSESTKSPAVVAPVLCENNCGFYGNSTSNNLCSKCYKDLLESQKNQSELRDETKTIEQPESTISCIPKQPQFNSVAPVPKPMELSPETKKVKKNRCHCCRKKLRLAQQFNCRCEQVFCAEHRFADHHDCQFDYKQHSQEILKKANPTVVSDKIVKI